MGHLQNKSFAKEDVQAGGGNIIYYYYSVVCKIGRLQNGSFAKQVVCKIGCSQNSTECWDLPPAWPAPLECSPRLPNSNLMTRGLFSTQQINDGTQKPHLLVVMAGESGQTHASVTLVPVESQAT
jgi:hypothetical protein